MRPDRLPCLVREVLRMRISSMNQRKWTSYFKCLHVRKSILHEEIISVGGSMYAVIKHRDGLEGIHGMVSAHGEDAITKNQKEKSMGGFQAFTDRLSRILILSCLGFVRSPWRLSVLSASSKSHSFLNNGICFRTSSR